MTFSRQIDILGLDGQKRLAHSTVAVAGVGGLGTVVSQVLVRAGVGRLILIDHDKVELSDLNRQILYDQGDIGKRKVEASSRHLLEIRQDIKIDIFHRRVDSTFFIDTKVDAVADCLDNYDSRFFLDRFCEERDILLVHAGISRLFGQVLSIAPGSKMRLRDVFKAVDGKHYKTQALCAACMTVGAIQAMEIINYLVYGAKGLSCAKSIMSVDLSSFCLERIPLA